MFEFKLDEIEDVGFENLPKGIYPVVVEKSEVKDTNDGKGKYINVELTISEGEFSGRKVFDLFNVVNESEKAENIGKGMLKQLIVASGADIEVFTDADQLVGLEMDIVLGMQKATEEYEERNKVKKYQAQKGEVDGVEESSTNPDASDSSAFD